MIFIVVKLNELEFILKNNMWESIVISVGRNEVFNISMGKVIVMKY